MPSPIISVTSPSHAVDVVMVTAAEVAAVAAAAGEAAGGAAGATAAEGEAAPSQSKMCTVTLARGPTFLDKDFVLLVGIKDAHQPRLMVERSPASNSVACMVTIAPQIELNKVRSELVFVIDCSGSMSGTKMADATRALKLFLRSLPANCYFNIVRFGSRFTKLWSASQRYSQETLQEAVAYTDATTVRILFEFFSSIVFFFNFLVCFCFHFVVVVVLIFISSPSQADLGGTELLPPLKDVLSQPPIAEYARQVFVLTDGEVSVDIN